MELIRRHGRGLDAFEVSIFLTELSTRHSILTRRKVFKSEKPRLGTAEGKMTGETREVPVVVGGDEEGDGAVVIREEEDEGKNELRLGGIPATANNDDAGGKDVDAERDGQVTKKRRRQTSQEEDAQDDDDEEEGLFLSDDSASSDPCFQTQTPPGSKREKPAATTSPTANVEGGTEDEKKKLALNTTYDGYAIYGRILCLIVKRRGVVRGKEVVTGTGQAVMEEWVRSTQVGAGEDGE